MKYTKDIKKIVYGIQFSYFDRDVSSIIFSFIEKEYYPVLRRVNRNWNKVLEHEQNVLGVDNTESFSYFALIGNLKMMKWCFENGFKWNYLTFDNIFINGNPDNIDWILDVIYSPERKQMLNIQKKINKSWCPIEFHMPTEKEFRIAFKFGNLNAMKRMVKEGYKPHLMDFYKKPKTLDMETVKWIRKNKYLETSCLFRLLGKFGDVSMLEWLERKRGKERKRKGMGNRKYFLIEDITLEGNLDAMKWGFSKNLPLSKGIFELAAWGGKLENMKWLRDIGCPWDEFTFCYAARNGNLENMKWLKENGCPWNNQTFRIAAKSKNKENIKWLLENECPRNLELCLIFRAAAKMGDLELMKTLKEKKFSWDEKTFEYAAKNGNLENMKWLKQNGCPWNAFVFQSAAKNGNLENMKWLKENGCPWNEVVFKYAARNGNLENMKWLKENGCLWDICTFYKALYNGNFDNIEWLRENECPLGEKSFYYAAKTGNLEILKWLLENNCPKSDIQIYKKPNKINYRCQKWLYDNDRSDFIDVEKIKSYYKFQGKLFIEPKDDQISK